MKAYKLEILVIDFDGLGGKGITEQIENVSYANDCVSVNVKKVTEVDIGEWSDSHPLNLLATCDEEYKKLFQEKEKQ